MLAMYNVIKLLYKGRKCPFASALTIDAQRMANEKCSELVISKIAYQKSDISDSSEDSSSAFLPDPINFDAAGSAFIGVHRCSFGVHSIDDRCSRID